MIYWNCLIICRLHISHWR